MIIVLGRVEVDPPHLAPWIQAVRNVEAATRLEAGCLSYAFGQDVASPGIFWLCESWTDLASIEAHLQTAHIEAFRAATASLKVRSFLAKRYDAGGETILISR
jgi:quinol monooxygenase YgiN